jgi:hypothetical protein
MKPYWPIIVLWEAGVLFIAGVAIYYHLKRKREHKAARKLEQTFAKTNYVLAAKLLYEMKEQYANDNTYIMVKARFAQVSVDLRLDPHDDSCSLEEYSEMRHTYSEMIAILNRLKYGGTLTQTKILTHGSKMPKSQIKGEQQ